MSQEDVLFFSIYLFCANSFIVEENKGHIWNAEEIMSHEDVLFMEKFWFENLNLFDLTLTWNPSKVKFDDIIGCNHNHCRYPRTEWPIKLVLHGMLELLFLATFCDLTLTLTFLSMTSVFMQYIY